MDGSTVNHLLCDLENTALMSMREFFEAQLGRRVGVLVFDGCMVAKGAEPLTDAELDAASDHIFSKTGYRLELVVKDMQADRLLVPAEVYCGPRCHHGSRSCR